MPPSSRSRDRGRDPQPSFQRNALVPGILGAVACFVGPALAGQEPYAAVLLVVAILALIQAYFAGQAGHWWWVPVFGAIAVAWNPVFPFDLEGPWWTGAHVVAGVLFLTAGALVRSPRDD
ncbi:MULTISPECIES: DUF6804 family protein [unclassified Agrococcus]|uniref:DUF6804 family protein n=1 Tax=unclassified Agrococcus TaxID=2615065 RepID=UPI003622E694